MIAIARKVSRLYLRRKEAEKAAGEALKQLSFMARSYKGAPFTEWELRAREQAIAAIGRLPEAATFQEMTVAAHTAGRQTAQEYEHSERRTSMIYGVQRLLPRLLPYSSPEKRTAAEEACSEAFARLLERKDLSDLVHSCTADRATFLHRLRLMARYPHRLLVITSTLRQIKSPYAHASFDPNRTTQFLIAVLAGLQVPFVRSETHELGEELVGSYLYQIHLYHWLEFNNYGRFLSDSDI